MNFIPLHDRVAIKPIDQEEKTVGGIIIPDSAKEKPMQGKVIAVGKGAKDKDGKHMSAVYNMGQFTVAAEKKVVEGADTNGGSGQDEKLTGKSIGVAFAATKELSVGYTQTKADTSRNSVEEETKIFAVGYNFGPVALAAQYQKVDNASSVDANDGDIVRVRLSTAF